MKKILVAFAILATVNSFAQIKLFPNGRVSVGQMVGNPEAKFKVLGKSLFAQDETTIQSAPVIKGTNIYSQSYSPDYTWFGDSLTGIFHPQPQQMAFTGGGVEQMAISQRGILIPTSGTPLTIFKGDPETVFFVRDFNANAGFNMNKDGTTVFRYINTDRYGVSTSVKANTDDSKHWLVMGPASDNPAVFFVTGDGKLRSNGPALIRVKEPVSGVAEIPNASTVVSQLKTFIQSGPTTTVGLLYDALHDKIPASTETYNGQAYINYSAIIPYLVAAIKEQSTQIANLNALVNKLRNPLGNNLGQQTGSLNGNAIGTDPSLVEFESNNITGLQSPLRGTILQQNQPNPFNQSTKIKYTLTSTATTASVLVFDMQGTLKSTKSLNAIAGDGELMINANELNPGIYYYSLVVNSQEIATKRMIITQ